MDKKLLLTIQWACNQKNVKIPWDVVGPEIESYVTGGAVVQHLAKLRERMVVEGLPVPPPLTRGGGRISKGSGVTQNKRIRKSRATKKTSRNARSLQTSDDEDMEAYSDQNGSGSSEDCGKRSNKKANRGDKKHLGHAIKKEQSDHDENPAADRTRAIATAFEEGAISENEEANTDEEEGERHLAAGARFWGWDGHLDNVGTNDTSNTKSKLVVIKFGHENASKLGLALTERATQTSASIPTSTETSGAQVEELPTDASDYEDDSDDDVASPLVSDDDEDEHGLVTEAYGDPSRVGKSGLGNTGTDDYLTFARSNDNGNRDRSVGWPSKTYDSHDGILDSHFSACAKQAGLLSNLQNPLTASSNNNAWHGRNDAKATNTSGIHHLRKLLIPQDDHQNIMDSGLSFNGFNSFSHSQQIFQEMPHGPCASPVSALSAHRYFPSTNQSSFSSSCNSFPVTPMNEPSHQIEEAKPWVKVGCEIGHRGEFPRMNAQQIVSAEELQDSLMEIENADWNDLHWPEENIV
ncbi:MAG: hypothetical protein Q9190_007239 [Brigantiaea leucoxantha]